MSKALRIVFSIRRAFFGLFRVQRSGLERVGEHKALLALLKADGHIAAAKLDHLAGAEFGVRYGRADKSAGNVDPRLFGRRGPCGSDRTGASAALQPCDARENRPKTENASAA